MKTYPQGLIDLWASVVFNHENFSEAKECLKGAFNVIESQYGNYFDWVGGVLSPESARMIDKFAMDVVANKEEVAKLVLQNGFKSGIGFQESTKNNILDLMNNFSGFKVNDKLLNPVLIRNVFKILKRPPTMTEVFYAITPTSFKNLISYFFFYIAFQFHDFVTVPVIAYLLNFLTVFVLFSSSRGLKLTYRVTRDRARKLLHR